MKLQNIQITLYFDSDISSEVFWICKDLIGDKHDVQPTLFPFGQNPAPQPDMLMAIMPILNGGQIQIGASFVTINTNNVDVAFKTGVKAIEVFSAYKITFHRIGVVSNYSFPNEKIKLLNKKIFSEASAPKLDFQYAKLSREDVTGISPNVNLWKRYYTAFDFTSDLLAETDINTPVSENHQIDCDFLVSFIEMTQKLSEKCFKEDDVL